MQPMKEYQNLFYYANYTLSGNIIEYQNNYLDFIRKKQHLVNTTSQCIVPENS